MAKKKAPKHASKMTNQEFAEAVFHPKVLAHARLHIEQLNATPKKAMKPKKKAI